MALKSPKAGLSLANHAEDRFDLQFAPFQLIEGTYRCSVSQVGDVNPGQEAGKRRLKAKDCRTDVGEQGSSLTRVASAAGIE